VASINRRNVLQRLIRQRSPSLVRYIGSMWSSQAEAITYNEIAEALSTGELSPATYQQWQEDYTVLVNDVIADAWNDSFLVGFNGVAPAVASMGGIEFVNVQRRLATWASARAGSLIVQLNNTQMQAVRNVLQYFISVDPINPRAAAQYIAPIVGLTEREAAAVLNFRAALQEAGYKGQALLKRTELYAGRLRRVRSERIARTELAFAHNAAQLESVKESRDLGYYEGETLVKRFLTAQDERVCPRCGPLGGWRQEEGGAFTRSNQAVVGLDDNFPADVTKPDSTEYVATPPLHPNCRCTILYETRA